MAEINGQLISELKEKIECGQITDIETYAYDHRVSRTKAVDDLTKGGWERMYIGKRGFFVRTEKD